MSKSLINISDLSVAELDELIAVANDMMDNPAKYAEVCRGKKLATLFYEPSTRTRLSFEAAMLELGGSVLGFSEATSSSAAKGESVADTAKVVSCYADIIAMRHPNAGAPYVASRNATIPVNVRVIAATNRNLENMVSDGTFRQDLYQRLNVVSLQLPPLRERTGDVVLMANAFLRELGAENNKADLSFGREALELLRGFDWPGNVRQLRTAVEHGVIMSSGQTITPDDLPEYLSKPRKKAESGQNKPAITNFGLESLPSLNLQYVEQQVILLALKQTGGNRSAAAELLGINRRTLQRKMAESPASFREYI